MKRARHDPETDEQQRRTQAAAASSSVQAAPAADVQAAIEAAATAATATATETAEVHAVAQAAVHEAVPAQAAAHVEDEIRVCPSCQKAPEGEGLFWDRTPCCNKEVCVECVAKMLIIERTLACEVSLHPEMECPHCAHSFEHAELAQ